MPSSRSTRRGLWATLGVVALLLIGGLVWWLVSERGEADASPSALPPGTHMGPVELLVNDLDTVTTYYRDAVGFDVLQESTDVVTLGLGDALIRLVATENPPDDVTEAGLYHSAVLFPDAASLANALARIAVAAPGSFIGASDHGVSQAFYFNDPEGNGLELYVDRPADEWVWHDGTVQMGNAYIDPNAFIREHESDPVAPGDVTMGHAHLRVGDLDEARKFYVDGLGFAETSAGDGAAFFGADGYHHHIGVNTWTSADAGERPPLAGLGSVTIVVPDTAALDAVAARLEAAGFNPARAADELTVADPWGSPIVIRVTQTAPR